SLVMATGGGGDDSHRCTNECGNRAPPSLSSSPLQEVPRCEAFAHVRSRPNGGPSWNRVVKNRRNLKSVGSRSRSASGSSGWRNASHHRQEATLADMGPAATSTTTLESARAPARAASSEARAAGTLSPESVAGLGFDTAEARNPLESARFNDSALT